KSSGFPSCSRTLDWDTEALRINAVTTANTLNSKPRERDYGRGSTPAKTELKGLFETTQFPKWYNPIDRIKTNQPHLNSTVNLTGRTGSTGYYMSFNNFVQQGAVRDLHGYNRQTARGKNDQTGGSTVHAPLTTGG